jgi:protein-S-isoprenylcysteine O-methyltransferase Ste14
MTYYRRATWVFIVDLIFLGFGALGLIGAFGNLADPSKSLIPSWTVYLQGATSVVAVALFVWAIVALVRFGVWAQRKAPAALEA